MEPRRRCGRSGRQRDLGRNFHDSDHRLHARHLDVLPNRRAVRHFDLLDTWNHSRQKIVLPVVLQSRLAFRQNVVLRQYRPYLSRPRQPPLCQHG